MGERDAVLLEKAAADLLKRGQIDVARQVREAAARARRETQTQGADIVGLQSGLFRLRDTEAPRPAPPKSAPRSEGESDLS